MFSKIIVSTIVALTSITTIATLLLCYTNQTTEPLTILLPSVFAECAAATTTYYWKAKAENKLKIGISAAKEIKSLKLREDQQELVKEFLESLND